MFSAAQILKCEFAPPCFRGGPHLGQLLHFSAWVIFSSYITLLHIIITSPNNASAYCMFSWNFNFLIFIYLFAEYGPLPFLVILFFFLAVYRLPFSPFRYCNGFAVYGGLSVHLPSVGLYGGFLPPPYSIGGASAAVVAVPFHARYLIRIQVPSVIYLLMLLPLFFTGCGSPLSRTALLFL